MTPISWGGDQPNPGLKAKSEAVYHAGCPHCEYQSTAQRQSKADLMRDRHVIRKHPNATPTR
jgi:hypothetical protein